VVVDGDDEFLQVHRQVENLLKQMVQNFGQIMFASERLGSERDTVEFRDQLYIIQQLKMKEILDIYSF
jgi:adenylate kinase